MTTWLADMRAISVRQPHAGAIFRAKVGEAKDIENRSWPTKYRGRLYIHTSLKVDWGAPEHVWPDPAAGTPWPDDDLPTGAVIGYVTLADCTEGARSRWAAAGQWHWVLGNPVPFLRPVPCSGKLGLWKIPAEVQPTVARATVLAGRYKLGAPGVRVLRHTLLRRMPRAGNRRPALPGQDRPSSRHPHAHGARRAGWLVIPAAHPRAQFGNAGGSAVRRSHRSTSCTARRRAAPRWTSA